MTHNLPPGYSVENGKIVRRWTDKKGEHAAIVANGNIEVISVRQNTDNPDELFLTTRFTSSDVVRYEDILIPAKQITGNGKKLLDFVPDWFVLLAPTPAKRLTFLQQVLNFQRIEIKEVVKIQRVGPGYHMTDDGILFYVLGNTVINLPSDVNLETTSPFHLRIDQHNANEPSGQGIVWDRKFCEQGPPQAALFVAALTAFIRPILEATNNFDRFGVYVVGESGTGKSETARLLCSFFKEASGITLSSDKTDIFRQMSLYRDLPFLVDDLNNSNLANSMHKKRERLSEVLQQIASAGILSIRGETFNVGLTTPIVTAESLLKSYSTLNRILIISYEKPFDADTLTWLQQHRDLYTDFLEGFICWLCQRHTRLETCVRSWDFSHLDGGIKNPDAFVGFHRLKRTFTILKITLELLLLHLREVYAIPQEDEKSWRRLLEEGVNQAVFADTLEHLRREGTEQDRFYLDAILNIFDGEKQAYKAKDQLVAKSYKKYVELNKCAKIDWQITKKIFFLSSDGCYYRFRGDDFVEYLKQEYGSQCKPSKKAFSAQLGKYGLLQPYGGELSYPAIEDSDHHYYNLRRNVVEDMQKERHDELIAQVDKLAFGYGGNDDQDWIIPRQ